MTSEVLCLIGTIFSITPDQATSQVIQPSGHQVQNLNWKNSDNTSIAHDSEASVFKPFQDLPADLPWLFLNIWKKVQITKI